MPVEIFGLVYYTGMVSKAILSVIQMALSSLIFRKSPLKLSLCNTPNQKSPQALTQLINNRPMAHVCVKIMQVFVKLS
jgi:hypothetical protein